MKLNGLFEEHIPLPVDVPPYKIYTGKIDTTKQYTVENNKFKEVHR